MDDGNGGRNGHEGEKVEKNAFCHLNQSELKGFKRPNFKEGEYSQYRSKVPDHSMSSGLVFSGKKLPSKFEKTPSAEYL